MKVKLDSRGRFMIPLAIRQLLDIEKELELTLVDNKIVIEKSPLSVSCDAENK